MSLLTICQNAAQEIRVAKPSTIVGNTDETAVMLLRAASRAGKVLARRHDWQVLQKEATITTADATASYALASDYDHHVNDTLWDRTNYWKMTGPTSPQDWQTLQSGIVTSGVRRWFRVKAGLMYIYPTPSSADTLAYEYVSNGWCQDAGGTAQTDWAADTDTGVISEYLIEAGTIWRGLKAMGMAYAEEKQEHDAEVDLAVMRDAGAPTVQMHGEAKFDYGVNVPEGGFG
jgi:hypothetical protein